MEHVKDVLHSANLDHVLCLSSWLEISDTHAHLDTASKSNITLHLTSIFRDFYMSTDLKSSVIHECNKQCRFFTANFLAISEI